jgi:uncharacterized protein
MMQFQWGEAKNQTNIRVHGFDFNDAWKVFAAPMAVALDDREDYGEDRWIGVGLLERRVVVVVFTEREDESIRIISLRKALQYERTQFEQFLKHRLGEG